MADHKTNHGRTKHIDIRHFFVRKHLEDKVIKVVYVPTAENLADLLTKAVTQRTFVSLRNQLLTTSTSIETEKVLYSA